MCDQSVHGAHRNVGQRCPVVLLSHLSLDSAAPYGRHVNGRRPSDVYGAAARARWKQRRRPLPLARSAASLRAARAVKSTVTSTALSSNCSSAITTSDNPAVHELLQGKTADDAVFMSNGDASGDVTPREDTSSVDNGVLSVTKFYNRRVATEHITSVTSPSAEASVEMPRSQSDEDQTPHSPSKHTNRKRKSPQQEAANRVKKTYDRTSSRTDKLSGRNTSLNRANRSAWRSPPTNSSRTDAVSSTSPSKDDDTETNADKHDVRRCDDVLPVVPIDEMSASTSIAALDVTDSDAGSNAQPKPDSTESLTSILVSPTTTSPAAVVTSPDSDRTSARNLKSRKRAEQTIFERFINALSLHKPRTSQKDDSVIASTPTTQTAEGDAIPSPVRYAKNETKVMQQSTAETDDKQLGTSNEQLQETLMKNCMKTSCSPNVANDTECDNSTSDGAQTNTVEVGADAVVNADAAVNKHENGDTEENEAGRRQNEEKKTRGVKASATRCREDSELLVTSRPVRKRQPAVYMDVSFDNYVKSRRKATLPTKTHGSCLLPPDFDVPLSKSSEAARQSWKTVIEAREKKSTRPGPGRPRKIKRQYKRRKGNVVEDDVQWTIHKKLLLGGPMSTRPKSASRSKFARKGKLKSSPKSSSVDFSRGKLWTRSMTRINGSAAKQNDTADDGLTMTAIGTSETKDEVRDICNVTPTSSESNSAAPSTNDAALSSNLPSSEAPAAAAATMPDSSMEDTIEEAVSCDTSGISATTTMTGNECVDRNNAVDTASATSPDDNVQHQEAEPEPELKVTAADVTSVDIFPDQSATKMIGSGSVSTTATNTDDSRVDDESVEALMHLVKQLQDAVANEKLRKAKGAVYLFHQSSLI